MVVVSQCFLTSCIYVVNYSCVGRKATFLVTSHRLQIAVYQFQVSLNLIGHPVARSTFVEFEQFFLQSCCIGSFRSSVEITVFVCIPASVSISTCYIYRATVNNSISYFSFFLIHCDSHRFNDVGIISLDNFSMSSRMSRSCITIAKVCNQLDRNNLAYQSFGSFCRFGVFSEIGCCIRISFLQFDVISLVTFQRIIYDSTEVVLIIVNCCSQFTCNVQFCVVSTQCNSTILECLAGNIKVLISFTSQLFSIEFKTYTFQFKCRRIRILHIRNVLILEVQVFPCTSSRFHAVFVQETVH